MLHDEFGALWGSCELFALLPGDLQVFGKDFFSLLEGGHFSVELLILHQENVVYAIAEAIAVLTNTIIRRNDSV